MGPPPPRTAEGEQSPIEDPEAGAASAFGDDLDEELERTLRDLKLELNESPRLQTPARDRRSERFNFFSEMKNFAGGHPPATLSNQYLDGPKPRRRGNFTWT